ncbi:hypothetical protein [Listeria booriae]|uniref:hypothetical protein n=1 Tax=Listeria booriae TaxID=1552123 RepID=UPI001C8B429A|nr:hypothetical protein [Listeria booriae]
MNKRDYSLLSDQDLLQVIEDASNEMLTRQRKLADKVKKAKIAARAAGSYEFPFSMTDKFSNKPYVARLGWDEEKSQITRDFEKSFMQAEGFDSHVTVNGIFKAAETDIFEIREGVTKIKIAAKGKLHFLCRKYDSEKFGYVQAYLAGVIDVDELLEICKDVPKEVVVPDDLKD